MAAAAATLQQCVKISSSAQHRRGPATFKAGAAAVLPRKQFFAGEALMTVSSKVCIRQCAIAEGCQAWGDRLAASAARSSVAGSLGPTLLCGSSNGRLLPLLCRLSAARLLGRGNRAA